MPVIRHTHTYGRWVKRSEQMYKCLDPHCTHFAPRSLVKDKISLCAFCHKEEVLMDWRQLNRAKACCLNCQDTKEARLLRANKDKIDSILALALTPIEDIKGDEES